MRCFVSPTYGPKGWTLPVQEVAMEDCLDRYKYFMRFLLEGKVFNKLLGIRVSANVMKKNHLSHTRSHTHSPLLCSLHTQYTYIPVGLFIWETCRPHDWSCGTVQSVGHASNPFQQQNKLKESASCQMVTHNLLTFFSLVAFEQEKKKLETFCICI